MNPKKLFIFAIFACLAPVSAHADASPDPAVLQLASVHAAVMDMDSGELLFGKHDDRVVPIASVTKLMTAVVVLDSGVDLAEWLTIVERERAPPVNAYSRIRVGSELRRADLLRITLMSSENLAAYVLARHHPDGGHAGFVAAMNDKARTLGMDDTRFVDSSGLSDGNRSTAGDLLRLLSAAMAYPEIGEYTRDANFTAHFRSPRYSLQYGNTNRLVQRNDWAVVLGKTGYLRVAGRCLVMVADMDGRNVGVVLLDAFGRHSPLGDAGRIRRWLSNGEGGSVAEAARRYERERSAAIAASVACAADGDPETGNC